MEPCTRFARGLSLLAALVLPVASVRGDCPVPTAADQLGDQICPLDDVDGDRSADFAIGDRYGGMIWIVSGRTGAPVAFAADAVRGPRRERVGGIAPLYGDVDGDGAWDLIDWGGERRGRFELAIRSGRDLHVVRIFALQSAKEDSITSATHAGDLDCDGVPDLAAVERIGFSFELALLSGRDGSTLRRVSLDALSRQERSRLTCFVRSPRSGPDDTSPHLAVDAIGLDFRTTSVFDPSEEDRDIDGAPLARDDHDMGIPGFGEDLEWQQLARFEHGRLGFVAGRDTDRVPDCVVLSYGSHQGVLVTTGCQLISSRNRAVLAPLALPLRNIGFDGVDATDLDDLDGDGSSEFLVGCYGTFGAAVVYSGRDFRVLRIHAEEAEYCPVSTCRFGASVARLGDTDGDGCGDYAITSAGMRNAMTPGCVSVFSGRTGARRYSIWKRDLLPRDG